MIVTIIGDVHGGNDLRRYSKLCKESPHPTIQVGDLSMNFSWLHHRIDTSQHFVLGGNHDCYLGDHSILNYPGYLGNHGLLNFPDSTSLFFIRGAYSIDKKWRTPGFDWWPEEELSPSQMDLALADYDIAKPEVVITHTCPSSVTKEVAHPSTLKYYDHPVTFKSQTSIALQAAFESHQPKLWIFGHFHKRVEFEVHGTQFICLDMFRDKGPNKSSYVTIDLKKTKTL